MPRIVYRYPDHLRSDAEALPAAPGIYIFHGDNPQLPLYIGKSVNLRARVLSHLRTRGEARMLRQARHISYQRTAGEVGALLLEAQLIKQQYAAEPAAAAQGPAVFVTTGRQQARGGLCAAG